MSACARARRARRRKKKARRERKRAVRVIAESLNRGLAALEETYNRHTFVHAGGPSEPPR